MQRKRSAFIVINPGQLCYLIHSPELENKLSGRLKEARDLFVFGCTVALRVSDLLKLTPKHIKINNQGSYLVVKQRTTTAKKLNFQYYLKFLNYLTNKLFILSDVIIKQNCIYHYRLMKILIL